tara:strand:- start:1309 stop:1782 length:474 start_codon:yes stop_codon:yes gene_type:complete
MLVKPIIGIPKWNWKKKVTQFAESHPNIEEIDITGTCHECTRHLEMLEVFDSKSDRKDTEYYRYYRRQDKPRKIIFRKMDKFKRLYKDIRRNGCHTPPVVTDDGCRLNGSHRLAILMHLKHEICKLNIVSYEQVFNDKRSKEIREHVKQYRAMVYDL